MKNVCLSIIGLSISIIAFGQTATVQKPTKLHVKDVKNQQEAILKNSISSETIIWEEDFANGLAGNNTSDSAWNVSGADGIIWEHDYDGSNGQYSTNNPDFEPETAVNGWMIFDADGSNTPGSASDFVMREGQLVSPMIDLSNYPNVSLSFTHAFRWCCSGGHEILIEISNDGGNTWIGSYSAKGDYITNETATTQSFNINITPIAGGQDSVKFRFNWDGAETASHYYWMIDDVKLITPPYNLLKMYEQNFGGWFTTPVTEGYALDYSFIPLSQASNNPYKFEAIITNEGQYLQEEVGLNVDVYFNGVLSSQANSNNLTLTPLQFGDDPLLAARDTFVTSSYTPTNTGVYYFDYFAESLDTVTSIFRDSSTVTDNEYGRDTDNTNTNYRYSVTNQSGDLEICNLIDIYNDENIDKIKAFLHEDSQISPSAQSATQVYGVVYRIAPGSTTREWVGQSNYLEINNQNNLGWIELNLLGNIPLTSENQYYICLGGMTNGVDTVYVGGSGYSYDQTSFWHDVDGTLQNNQGAFVAGTWYYVNTTPMVRGIMGDNTSSITNNEIGYFEITPNPSNGMITIHSKEYFSKVIVKDLLGKIIIQIDEPVSTIDLSNIEKGTYLISLENLTGTTTRKLILH